MNDNDSSRIESDIWGARAHDWAEIEDEASRSLFQVILDAASVGKGTKLLDIGCGSGLAGAMGANLGAKVSGLDSSPNLLKIAKKQVPDGDFRLGDYRVRTRPRNSKFKQRFKTIIKKGT
jgi:cyclopropane fatty-acyl-phospholipid synthase-like methyltransferase